MKAEEAAQKKEEEEEDTPEQIPVTPVPREWQSHGSDLEVQEGYIQRTRPLVRD